MKTIALAASILLLASCAQHENQQETPEVSTVSIAIPSAQCSMCDGAITKALKEAEGVQEATVDLEAKTVSVTFSAASLSLSDLENVITKAGYVANDKPADPEAYENLPGCCKLPDDEGEKATESMESM